MEDLYIGAVLTIYGKELKIIDYAEVFTKNHFEEQKQM